MSVTAKQILSAICSEHNHTLTYSEAKDALLELSDCLNKGEDEFTFELDGNEYRIISDDRIWGIYVDTIKDIVQDCYDLKFDNIPHFVVLEIDWEETANNCYADGYGHTFSSYDGSEIEVANYWVFRTN